MGWAQKPKNPLNRQTRLTHRHTSNNTCLILSYETHAVYIFIFPTAGDLICVSPDSSRNYHMYLHRLKSYHWRASIKPYWYFIQSPSHQLRDLRTRTWNRSSSLPWLHLRRASINFCWYLNQQTKPIEWVEEGHGISTHT